MADIIKGIKTKDGIAKISYEAIDDAPDLTKLAPVDHTHNIEDIVSGALPIENGGTGATTSEDALVALGAAAATHSHSGYAISGHTHSGYASSSHNHSASNITSGTLSVARGGTGISATDLDDLKNKLGITSGGGSSDTHTHNLSSSLFTGVLPIEKGGTGATDAATARANLGITLSGSGSVDAGDITSGVLPIERGGTGANNAQTARANIGAAASNHSHTAEDVGAAKSSHTHSVNDIPNLNIPSHLSELFLKLGSTQYGSSLPASGTAGQLFFKI